MTFVDSSCLGRFLDSELHTHFDGQMLKRYMVQHVIRKEGHVTQAPLVWSGCLQVKAEHH